MRGEKMKLSLVIPCYNEEGNVEKFFDEVNKVFGGKVADYEFVFVNDGSKDKTYQKLKQLFSFAELGHLLTVLPEC